MHLKEGVYVGETDDETASLSQYRAIIKSIWDKSHERAKLVFEKFIEGGELANKGDDTDDSLWAEEMEEVIFQHLDERSIGAFVELVIKSQLKASQAAKARKRHAEHHAMKAEVFQWLDAQKQFKSIEVAAMAITKQVPILAPPARCQLAAHHHQPL